MKKNEIPTFIQIGTRDCSPGPQVAEQALQVPDQ